MLNPLASKPEYVLQFESLFLTSMISDSEQQDAEERALEGYSEEADQKLASEREAWLSRVNKAKKDTRSPIRFQSESKKAHYCL